MKKSPLYTLTETACMITGELYPVDSVYVCHITYRS